MEPRFLYGGQRFRLSCFVADSWLEVIWTGIPACCHAQDKTDRFTGTPQQTDRLSDNIQQTDRLSDNSQHTDRLSDNIQQTDRLSGTT